MVITRKSNYMGLEKNPTKKEQKIVINHTQEKCVKEQGENHYGK